MPLDLEFPDCPAGSQIKTATVVLSGAREPSTLPTEPDILLTVGAGVRRVTVLTIASADLTLAVPFVASQRYGTGVVIRMGPIGSGVSEQGLYPSGTLESRDYAQANARRYGLQAIGAAGTYFFTVQVEY